MNNSKFFASKNSFNENQKEQSIYNPNLLDINGPNLTLIFSQVSAKTILQEISKLGGYDFVWVNQEPTFNSQGSDQVVSSFDQESNQFQPLNLEALEGSEDAVSGSVSNWLCSVSLETRLLSLAFVPPQLNATTPRETQRRIFPITRIS